MQTLLSGMIKYFSSSFDKLKLSTNAVFNSDSIKENNKRNLLVENLIPEGNFNPNSITLTLSNSWYKEIPNRVEDGLIDTNLPPKYDKGDFSPPIGDPRKKNNFWEASHYTEHEHYILHPQYCVMIKSREIINIPSGMIGIVSQLTDRLQSGISIETEMILETGFRDHLTFSIHNRNNYAIVLYSGMQIVKIGFIKAKPCSFIKR